MNQSGCGELCISFDPYSFFEINNFSFTRFFSFFMSIYGKIIILLACYRVVITFASLVLEDVHRGPATLTISYSLLEISDKSYNLFQVYNLSTKIE